MANNFCVFLDAGHGGIGPDGNYTTAPGKQYQHQRGRFHQGNWFLEGVWNRALTRLVMSKLQHLGIPYYPVFHEYADWPLQYRVDLANWYHQNYRRGFFISNHANASGLGARGYEVYTSPGVTTSDRIANWHWEHTRALLGDRITMRADQSDGDYDKEARFFVLTKTVMPAILVEHLFFDQYEDALLLMDPEIIDRFAEAQVRTIISYINSL